jgi:ribonuclease J
VHARGFAESDAVFASVIPAIEQSVNDSLASGTADLHQLQQLVRRTTGRWVSSQHRRRPMIIPVVVEG